MRLIDADAIFPNGVFYVNGGNPMASLDELINRINNAPTVNAIAFPLDVWVCNKLQYLTVHKYLAEHHFVDKREIRSLSELICVINLYDGVFASLEEAEAALAERMIHNA